MSATWLVAAAIEWAPILDLLRAHALKGGVVVGVVGVAAVMLTRKRSPEYLDEVRRLAAAGQLREAGDLQLRHGNLAEAYNLYVRGEAWDRASFVAHRQGALKDAAEFAEKDRDWDRAAKLYEEAKLYGAASVAHKAAGRLEQAAELLERDNEASLEARGAAWRDAFNHLRASDGDDDRIPRLAKLAERARKAFACAGNEEQAEFFEIRANPKNLQALENETKTLGAPDAPRGQPVAAVPVAPPGDSRYVLGRKLGQGGMGAVYEATDKLLGRSVALKLLPEQLTPSNVARELFAKEAKAAAALTHPNIVVLYDYGVHEGRPFLSMELVPGGSVAELLTRNTTGLPLEDVFDIAKGLLTGLSFAHARRVIHRDIKPANILFTPDRIVKLTDFGIAKVVDTHRDATTLVAGTPAYMAPEQFEGKGIDQRTDIFGAGATIYELLTGGAPFSGMDRSVAPPPPSAARPDTPRGFDEVVMACLAKDRERRPASCQAVLTSLARIGAPSDSVPRGASAAVGATLPSRRLPPRRTRPRLEYSSRGAGGSEG